MTDIMATIYSFAAYPVLVMLGMLAMALERWPLVRCFTVLLLGQVAIDVYGAFVDYSTQPWGLYLAINAASCAALTVKPASQTCQVLGGIFLGSTFLSIFAGMTHGSVAADYAFWQSQVLTGWLSLFVVIGGSTGDTGKRIVRGIWRRIANVAHAAVNRGYAR
jgi:hypothetical protein